MRILLASPKGHVSGGIARWTRHIINYYESLDDKGGVDLLFFDTAREKQIPDNITARLYRAFADIPKLLRRFSIFLKNNEADVLHLTSSASLGLIRDMCLVRMAKKKGLKMVIHFRFGRTPELRKQNNWEWKLLCKIIKLVNTAIFIDKESYMAAIEAGFSNVALLPNPISPAVNSIIEQNGEEERIENLVLFVGHCTKKKGIIELVEACLSIPNINVKIVGTIIDDLQDFVKKVQGVNNNIFFVGEEPYDEIIRDMLKCGVFALPSYTEGFPNVILEAMACGCAIVGTKVGAIPEMLENDGHYCGELIESQNVEELRKAIQFLLNHLEDREEARKNVRERVFQRYSMEANWQQLTQIWRNTQS